MNNVARILVVFITASSLGFLAFVTALRNGGPDWMSEIRSADAQRPTDLQKEFVFTVESGEKVTYSAKHRRTEKSVIEKSPILAEVVLKARKQLEEDTNKQYQALAAQPQPLQDAIKTLNELIPVDKAGVEAREKFYNDRIQQLWTQIENVGNQFSEFTIKTQEVLRVAQVRREEVYRLSNLIELLRNDHFAALEQKRFLEDELIRLEQNRKRLEGRKRELKIQLGDEYELPSGAE
jgi:chromosome segregation ATPase